MHTYAVAPEKRNAQSEANGYVILLPSINTGTLLPVACPVAANNELFRGRHFLVVCD
jgi:hypothetical protein